MSVSSSKSLIVSHSMVMGVHSTEADIMPAAKALCIFIALTSADGYKTLLSHLGPDPKEKSLFLVTLGPKLGCEQFSLLNGLAVSLPRSVLGFLQGIAVWIVRTFLKDPLFASTMSLSRVKPVEEYMAFTKERDEYIKLWYKEVRVTFLKRSEYRLPF